MRCVLAVLLACFAATAFAADTETTWMKVLLDGRKIGHVVHHRTVDGDRVTNVERMEATLDRAGVSIGMVTEEKSIETADGKPVGFEAVTEFSGMTTKTVGVVEGDKANVTTTSVTGEQKSTIDWPKGAMLAEGARRFEASQPTTEGTTYELLMFQPSGMMAVPVKVKIGALESVQLGLEKEKLRRVEQRVEFPGATLDTQSWIDAGHNVRKTQLPLLGLNLEMIACDEACAKAPNQPSDILDRTMVTAPRSLPRDLRNQPLDVTLELADGSTATLPDVAEQDAEKTADGEWRLNVAPGAARDRAAPTDDERNANRWLEVDDPKIREMASAATKDAKSPLEKMQALEEFVRGYIANKSLRIGYASALETVQSKEGDCTEHALLLAALGRAIGIPTRVVNGLAYAEAYAGRERVFVPHAWVQAYVGDHWRSFDAALPGFDAGHLAFSTGNGDPAGFYASVNLLGNVKVDAVEAAK